MAKQNSVRVRAGQNEFAATSTTTDAPLLPLEQLERLAQLRPDKLDWVFEQTQLESQHRRTETSRINIFIFVERLAGLVFALIIAILGLGVATYLAMNGKDIVAGIIGGTTLVGLVTTFIVGKKQAPENR